MAIAFDAASYSGLLGPASTGTLSHTCGTGSDRILFVGFFADTNDTVTGVTYAGQAMTQINKIKVYGNRWTYLYYIVAPATGANNIVVTSSYGSCYFGIVASSYTGAAQTGIPDANITAGGGNTSNTSLTTTLTTIADNCWTVMVGRATTGAGAKLTAGTGATERAEYDEAGTGGTAMFDSNGVITPAGSKSMTFTWGTGQPDGSVMASFAPASSTTTTTTTTTTAAPTTTTTTAAPTTTTTTTPAPPALTDNLVAYWAMDESSGNPQDSTANNNDLTNNNSTAFATGKLGNAASLAKASSNSFSITDANMTGLDILGDISHSFWIKLTSQPSGGYPHYHLINRWDETGNQRGYNITYGDDGGGFAIKLAIASDIAGVGTTDIYEFPCTLTNTTWFHLVLTWDASAHTANLYINNTLQTPSTGLESLTSIPNATSPLRVGCFLDAGTPAGLGFVDGLMDEIGIWDRTLNSTDVTTLYNSGTGYNPIGTTTTTTTTTAPTTTTTTTSAPTTTTTTASPTTTTTTTTATPGGPTNHTVWTFKQKSDWY